MNENRQLQIALVSKADAAGGGASAVAEILAHGLPSSRTAAVHYCLYADQGFSYARRPIGGHAATRLQRRQQRLKTRYSLAEVLPLEAPFFEGELERLQIDLMHFHDLSSAVSPLTLARLSRRVPLVWTLHDCSGFTGGCLYPLGCTRYRNRAGCIRCPQSGVWPIDTRLDTAWLNHRLRRRVHTAPQLHLVSPSNWLAEMARSSGMVNKPVTVIPNGIPRAPFEALDRDTARDSLGIDRDATVVYFTAGHLSDTRKNVADTISALRATARTDIVVIALGRMSSEIAASLEGMTVIAPGYVADRRQIATHLAAADAMLFTSLAENHPLAVLEAMAAGTAVLGYATGGVAEQVVSGATGVLVPPGDRDALAAMLRDMLDPARLAPLGRAARARFHDAFTDRHMIAATRAFYERLLRHEPEVSCA